MLRTGHRLVAAVASAAFVSSSLAGCTDSSTNTGSFGVLEVIDGRAHITVPALWAAAQPDGTRAGGVEPAEIFVSTAGETSTYGVDLADIEAKGAGPAWQAATSMASAFATIFVGADPNSVDYHFTVSGPIDGPSAGGILTVGIIAAFRGASLRPGATMTGTITADGSIGVVTGVVTKMEAAAREGFTTVVVPAALDSGDWSEGNRYTEVADSLGITVVPVNTIGDAYAVMTGEPLPEEPPLPVTSLSWPASVEQVTSESTRALLETLDSFIASAAGVIDDETLVYARETARQARAELASGSTARAYGTTAFALVRVSRAMGTSAVQAVIDTQGIPAAKDDLRQRAQALLAASREALHRDSQIPVMGLEQRVALAVALAWATFSEVTMEGLLAELPSVTSADALLEMGRSIAEGEVGLRVMLPDAVVVAASVPSRLSGDDAAALLAEYSAFILRAAEAGEKYLTDVLGSALTGGGEFANSGYVVGAIAARELSPTVTPAVDDFPAEARQLSLALTYFWLVSHALSSAQAYEIVTGRDADDQDANRQDAMDAAIDDTWDFVVYRSRDLATLGGESSGATWSAAWAFEQDQANRGTELATESGWFAQGELWYDAVQVMMLIADTRPSTIRAPTSGTS